MMRYEHYERVVRWDRRNRFPERGSVESRPGLEKRTRMWGRKEHGYGLEEVMLASSAMGMRTGKRPSLVHTRMSVAERRLKKGDAVGCMVKRTGKEAYGMLEERRVMGRPEMLEAGGGLSKQGKGTVDSSGKMSFHRSNPGVLSSLRMHYEEYYPLVSKPSCGRYRSVDTGAKSRPVGRARREGRRRPR